MRKNFILKDASGKEMILPVTPAGWQGEAGRKANSLNMHTVGAVNLPGGKVLLNETLHCHLPASKYPCHSPEAVIDHRHSLQQRLSPGGVTVTPPFTASWRRPTGSKTPT